MPPEPSSSSSKLPPPACAHCASERRACRRRSARRSAEYVRPRPAVDAVLGEHRAGARVAVGGSSVTSTGPAWPGGRAERGAGLGRRAVDAERRACLVASTLGSALVGREVLDHVLARLARS